MYIVSCAETFPYRHFSLARWALSKLLWKHTSSTPPTRHATAAIHRRLWFTPSWLTAPTKEISVIDWLIDWLVLFATSQLYHSPLGEWSASYSRKSGQASRRGSCRDAGHYWAENLDVPPHTRHPSDADEYGRGRSRTLCRWSALLERTSCWHSLCIQSGHF